MKIKSLDRVLAIMLMPDPDELDAAFRSMNRTSVRQAEILAYIDRTRRKEYSLAPYLLGDPATAVAQIQKLLLRGPKLNYIAVLPPGTTFATAGWDVKVAEMFDWLGDRTILYDKEGNVPILHRIVLETPKLLEDCIDFYMPSIVINSPKGGYDIRTLLRGQPDKSVSRRL